MNRSLEYGFKCMASIFCGRTNLPGMSVEGDGGGEGEGRWRGWGRNEYYNHVTYGGQ